MQHIFIVEDDHKLSQLLSNYLSKNGFRTTAVYDFNRVMEQFERTSPDLVLLDINLPQFDGFYWCRQIRLRSVCPVIFISTRDNNLDQVRALENGADDYIVKPFQYEIVLAKVRSQLRRAYGTYSSLYQERKIEAGLMTLYPERLVLQYNGHSVQLTQKELMLMEVLINKAERVVGRSTLLELMWEDQHFIDDNTLNVYITRVRRKLKPLGGETLLETVRGIGYRLLTHHGSCKDDVK